MFIKNQIFINLPVILIFFMDTKLEYKNWLKILKQIEKINLWNI